jgi:uncharacterized caspase-like protein
MQMAIQKLFTEPSRDKDDLVLLYFSGHGLTDDDNDLYLAASNTDKQHFESRSVPASFIQKQLKKCRAKRQVLVLDACYSGAFPGWQSKSADLIITENIKNQLKVDDLGAEGRVVLTSSSATEMSFQQKDSPLSLYTQYLVEGMETGAADKDCDGKIYVRELHAYANEKVQAVKPNMRPNIIVHKEGYDILIANLSKDLKHNKTQQKSENHDISHENKNAAKNKESSPTFVSNGGKIININTVEKDVNITM